MEIEAISYKKVIDGYVPQGDKYGLAAYALAEPRKTTFLSNPFLTDTSKVMLKLLRDNETIIGRSMMFPSRFKAGGKFIETMGGSALEIAETYRGGDAGGSLMAYNIRHKENNALISSGFSDVAAKCHRALRAYMLEFPQYVQIRDYRTALLKCGKSHVISNILGGVINVLTWPFIFNMKKKVAKLLSVYQIKKVSVVPEWIDDVVLKDGHDFMEVHNHQWFQWNLDNMFHAHEKNINGFYVVSKGNENLGFFMIKERAHKINKDKNDEMVIGTICEWGTNNSILSEYDIHLMALNYFSKNVDAIYMATTDADVAKRMKKLLFIQKGLAQIAFYDLRKQFKEAKDIKNWRVRLGTGDSVLN